MPNYEIALPPGAKNIKIKTSTQEIPVDWQFYRHGKDGAEVIVPLFGGDEFVGEVLEGNWKKGDDRHIQNFVAKLNGSSHLQMSGRSDVAGTYRHAWVYSQSKICFGAGETIVEFELEVPSSISSGSIIYFVFYLIPTISGNPINEDNYLRLYLYRNESAGAFYYAVHQKVNGTGSFLVPESTEVSNPNVAFKFVFQKSDGHIHIYIDDGETGSWTEVPNSPFSYDITFDAGYIAYALQTKDDVTRTCYSDYVRVTYPDFKVVYDLDDADVGKGDVKVWDTMGSSDESDWQRVFDVNHQFVGDCVVENGLIRFRFSTGLHLYFWDGNSWVECGYFLHYDGSTNDTSPSDIQLITVTTEASVISFVLNSLTHLLRLERGNPAGQFTVRFPSKITNGWMRMNTASFDSDYGYAPEGKVMDSALNIDGSSDSTPADNFALHLSLTKGILMTSSTARMIFQNTYRELGQKGISSEEIHQTYGFVPFTQVSNLFKEAEDATLADGATVDTTQTDDSGDSVLLDAYADKVSYFFTGGTDLPTGRYLAFVRVKDTNQVVNDLQFYVYNNTDVRFINEENDYTYVTLTSSFAYYGIVFDISDDDINDTLRITVAKTTSDANSIYVDYFLIVPIGNGESWPQDLAHSAMRTFTKRYKVYKR